MRIKQRLAFAHRYAAIHLLISLLVALASAGVVFGLLYPPPWRQMLVVTDIYVLILIVDVVCGPAMTLILASPEKSRRERWLDFSCIGLLQALALAYGMHSVWIARPVVLGFERDRLVLVTANEIDHAQLAEAPPGLQRLAWWGVTSVSTRVPRNNAEFFESTSLGLAGVSPAMRPGWWLPYADGVDEVRGRARTLDDLFAARARDRGTLMAAARRTGLAQDQLRWLPLTSSRTMDWVALLDNDMKLVGWAPIDGFTAPAEPAEDN